MATIPTHPVQFSIGSPVWVSQPHDTFHHFETQILSDPGNRDRLFIAAIQQVQKDQGNDGIIGYYSSDGGKTWQPTLGRLAESSMWTGDPTLAYGPDGRLHLACMRVSNLATGANASRGDTAGVGYLDLYHSDDAGKNWKRTAALQHYVDRPWLAVDTSDGPHRGHVYCVANIGYVGLYTSTDGGANLQQTHVRTKGATFGRPSNAIVLSNGTLLIAHNRGARRYPDRREEIEILKSADGGRTLVNLALAPTRWADPRIKTMPTKDMPQLAVEPADGNVPDRLHLVWTDGHHPAIRRLLYARSDDCGKTWQGPMILSEQPPDIDPAKDYGIYWASIAVNQAGAVAVFWYDRRGFSLDYDPSDQMPAGCNARVRISTDGGATWHPSVLISDEPIKASLFALRDTSGITADAAGRFHAAWIEDRTGTRQVWTTTLVVGNH